MNLTLRYIIVIICGKNYLSKFYNLIIHFGTGIILLIRIYNKRNIRLDKCIIYTNKLKGKLTICHLSDIHLGIVYGKLFIKKLVQIKLKIFLIYNFE